MARNYSTFAIAEMLHVDPGSVANWIDQSLLKAHRTPGGHRRVATEDLVTFLRQHKMPIPPDLDSHPARVLIVDDEPSIAQLIARAVREACPHLEVTEAHDGFQAGTLVATLQPDVVILDLRMPGMDGYEVCRMIKANSDSRHVEVIAMTAFPSPENEKRIIECGAKTCLSKPLNMEELLRRVRAAV